MKDRGHRDRQQKRNKIPVGRGGRSRVASNAATINSGTPKVTRAKSAALALMENAIRLVVRYRHPLLSRDRNAKSSAAIEPAKPQAAASL